LTLREVEVKDGMSAVRAADAAGEPVFVLGGGSNTLMADAGFPGTVVRLAFDGIEVLDGGADADGGDRAGEAVVVRVRS
jgi:UDP-N-acetylmuramate dehydrogenase